MSGFCAYGAVLRFEGFAEAVRSYGRRQAVVFGEGSANAAPDLYIEGAGTYAFFYRGILHSEEKNKVLLLLLDEQARQINREIETRQKQLQSIRFLQNNVQTADSLPVNAISDVERMMKNVKNYVRHTESCWYSD